MLEYPLKLLLKVWEEVFLILTTLLLLTAGQIQWHYPSQVTGLVGELRRNRKIGFLNGIDIEINSIWQHSIVRVPPVSAVSIEMFKCPHYCTALHCTDCQDSSSVVRHQDIDMVTVHCRLHILPLSVRVISETVGGFPQTSLELGSMLW